MEAERLRRARRIGVLYAAGASLREAGQAEGVSISTALHDLQALGITRRTISAAKQGHVTSLEARAKMAAAKRKFEPEPRFCQWPDCGRQIMPKRAGVDIENQNVLARLRELGLDRFPGHAIRKGEGRFCCDSHHLLWAWTHDRERFPQDGPGPSEFKCSICGRAVERWPSQIANAKQNAWRFICEVCVDDYRRFRQAAQMVLVDLDRTQVFSSAALNACEAIWEIGEEFEAATLSRWPKSKGRRPPLASDLVIATLYRKGFKDETIRVLLNKVLAADPQRRIPGLKPGQQLTRVQYVTTRRQRTSIRRRS